MKAKITLSYDGSKFHGYQEQNSGVATVANTLQNAFKSLGIESKFEASGRTDRGVHATNQVLSITLPSFWRDIKELKKRLNFILPSSIFIKKIEEVDSDFHARFSAKSRVYRYVVKSGERDVFRSDYITYVKEEISLKRVSEAIKLFGGEHDFRAFMKEGSDVNNTIREIKRVRFYNYRDHYIFCFEADGFLRSQIRMMVAFLLKISNGELTANELKMQLKKEKIFCRDLALPNGLYLAKIKY